MNNNYRKAFAAVLLIGLIGFGLWYFSRITVPHTIFEQQPVQVATSTATATVVTATAPVKIAAVDLPAVENKAFKAGEKLTYNVIFKGITVGQTVIQVKSGADVNKRPTLQFVSTAETSPFFDAFFKVRDENVSTVDTASLFSVAFYQNLHEGKYEAIRNYNFNYSERLFSAIEKKKSGTKKNAGALHEPVYDVLSALYAVRAHNLVPGQDLTVSIFRDENGKPITIKVDGITKELKTPLGKVLCLRIEPVIQGDSLFKEKQNRLVVWMTADEKKIPVLIEATISAGLIRVKLDKFE